MLLESARELLHGLCALVLPLAERAEAAAPALSHLLNENVRLVARLPRHRLMRLREDGNEHVYEHEKDEDDEGEECPRLDDEGNELYVIEFFDTWSDSYVESPNPGLQMPGFSAIFALISLLGISILRRRV